MKNGIRLTASPRGKRVGLCYFAQDGHTLSVLVLPKPWQRSVHVKRRVQIRGSHVAVVLCELDDVVLGVTDRMKEFLLDVQARMIDRSRSGAAALRGEPGKYSASADEAETDDEEQDQLISISPSKASPEAIASGEDEDGGELIALMMLAARCDQWEHWIHDAGAGDGDCGLNASANRRAATDPLLVLVMWRYVLLVELLLSRVHRGYVPVIESAPVLRGRLTQRGLVTASTRQNPAVECAHDEFTDTTPLFRVIVTALDKVARAGVATRHGLGEWSLMAALQRRAVHLRRLLAHIPSLGSATARAEAARLRSSQVQRHWRQPLDLARQILQERPPYAHSETSGTALQWWVASSRLWEQILVQAARTSGWQVSEQGDGAASRPWLIPSSRTRREDILLRREAEVVVIDAKYKRPPVTPSAPDQNQLFTYSALRGARRVALAYPRFASEVVVPQQEWRRGSLSGAESVLCTLHHITAPFPAPGDLHQAAWEQYICRVTDCLAPVLTDGWQPPS